MKYETPSPAIAPGIASIAVRRLALSTSPAASAIPTTTAPRIANTNAPTMPPQKWSGTKTAKCQMAMPIMIQTRKFKPPPRLSAPAVLAAAALTGTLLAVGSFRPDCVHGPLARFTVARTAALHRRRLAVGLGLHAVGLRFELQVAVRSRLGLGPGGAPAAASLGCDARAC